MANTSITPLAGALALGITIVVTSITPQAGALSIGTAPNVSITPSAGSLTATGQVQSLTPSTQITPDSGSLFFGIQEQPSRRPVQGALSLAGGQPTFLISVSRQPGAGSLTLSGNTVIPSQAIDITVAILEWPPVPGATAYHVKCGPSSGNYTRVTDIGAPTTQCSVYTAVGGEAGLWFAVVTASNVDGESPASPEVAFDAEYPSAEITPSAGTLSAIGQVSELGLDLEITPTEGSLLATGQHPLIATGGPIRVPTEGTVTLAGNQPVLSRGTVITPKVGALGFTGYATAPPVTITPQAGALVTFGRIPTLSVTVVPTSVAITPDEGRLELEGAKPKLGGIGVLTPTNPIGVRSISLQPWFIKPTLIADETSILVELPLSLFYYQVKVAPDWNTGWWMTDQTTTNFMLHFTVPVPTGAEVQIEVIG